ncbi:DEAD/DEAH box helicase, partial [Cooperia oncophora]
MLFTSLRYGLSRLAIADKGLSSTRIFCTASARAPTSSGSKSNPDRYTRQTNLPLLDQKKAFQIHHTAKMRDNQYDRYGGGSRGGGGRGRLRDIDWSKENLKPIQKDFYHEHATVSRREQYEIDQWITENQVTVDGRSIPRPVWEFSEASFPNELVDLLYAKFQKPTVIQSISWPIAMSGRDIISIAKTGSGKTLAVSVDFCTALGLKMTCLFGGASKAPQARDLERGVDVAVATPGRLLDFLDNNTTNIDVLTKAEYRMLDMGFEPQIRKIIGQIRPDRQTLMFSATWPKEVRALASDFQKDAAFLNVGSMELAANHNITQFVDVLEEHAKQARMMQLLNDIMNQPECKTIIFVETKRKADDLTRWMRRDGWPTLCIHGDKNQGERDWVLSGESVDLSPQQIVLSFTWLRATRKVSLPWSPT